jgi:hypothetical protein
LKYPDYAAMRIILIHIIMLLSLHAGAQNYIGMSKDQIVQVLHKQKPGFKVDKNSVNRSFNVIKFVDKISEQTMLFFLSEKDICTYVRWMSDYANLNDIIAELDQTYKKRDDKSWYYTDKNQEYIVRLEEGDWFFTVSIRKK